MSSTYQEEPDYKHTKIKILKEELFSYILYSYSLINYIQEELGNAYSQKLKIIKDHLYTKQNAAPNPKLRFKLVDGTLDKAIALYIPKEGELKNNIFLITPFGTIKIATILSDDFDQETFKTALENLNLEQDEEYFFAQNDHLGKPIAHPATAKDINTSYLNSNASEALAKQFLIILEQIISEASHINDSPINDLIIDTTTTEGEFIDFFSIKSLKHYIPTSSTISQFIAWTIIPVALASIAIYYHSENKNYKEPEAYKDNLQKCEAYIEALKNNIKKTIAKKDNIIESHHYVVSILTEKTIAQSKEIEFITKLLNNAKVQEALLKQKVDTTYIKPKYIEDSDCEDSDYEDLQLINSNWKDWNSEELQ